MDKFTTLTGVAAPFPLVNVDTDMIYPARYLTAVDRGGEGEKLFFAMRFNEDGSEKPDFVLNKLAYRHAKILITGENFGCGSSREHAPWALQDFGIRGFIGTAFADIFFNNCFKNALLPIVLPKETIDILMQDAEDQSGATMTIDLTTQEITRSNGDKIPFEVDAFRKHCLLNGLDDIGMTLEKAEKIKAFEEKRALATPWLASLIHK